MTDLAEIMARAICPDYPLDAVCTECMDNMESALAALSDADYAVVPREPTSKIIDTLYGPYISLEADKSRTAAYRDMISAWEKEK